MKKPRDPKAARLAILWGEFVPTDIVANFRILSIMGSPVLPS